MLHLGDALDLSEEFLDPLLGFRGQNLSGKFSAVSQDSLCHNKTQLLNYMVLLAETF